MEIDQIKLLTSAYENIIEQQYLNAIPNFELGSLEDKQVCKQKFQNLVLLKIILVLCGLWR